MAEVPFSSVQEFSETCMKATRPDQIARPLSTLAGSLGLTSWYAGSLLHESELCRSGFGFYEGSAEWSRRYTDERYSDIDPVFEHAKLTERPFRWSEKATLIDKSDKRAWRVLGEASEFGVREGFTKAWHGFGEVPGVVTFGGLKPDLSQESQMSLLLVGAFAYEGFRRVTQGFKPVPLVLTRRELDVLRWSAEGKTAWEIGQILSIAERTVRCYLAQLKRKYAVPTMMQVVVLSMLDGNLKISPSTRQN